METRARLPTFKGKPFEIPSFILQIGFMEGDFGRAFLEEYYRRVKADYKGNSVLDVLKYENDVVKGSNSFAVVLANQILRQEGLRTATQADLEKALKAGALNLRGTYEDTGLVLMAYADRDNDRNNPLIKDLANQIRAKGIKFNSKNPVIIPLTGLELQIADKYHNDYGLTFRLREDAEAYNSPILVDGGLTLRTLGDFALDYSSPPLRTPPLFKNGNFNSEDIDEKTGLPTKLSDGKRTLYARDEGISRLRLDGGLNLSADGRFLDGSGGDDLSVSGGCGRVVVVGAEGTLPQNLQVYWENLRRARREEIAKI
ncbi:MAG: hypothetical protein AAB922_02265 [Patescibacteria group bacterium]